MTAEDDENDRMKKRYEKISTAFENSSVGGGTCDVRTLATTTLRRARESGGRASTVVYVLLVPC